MCKNMVTNHTFFYTVLVGLNNIKITVKKIVKIGLKMWLVPTLIHENVITNHAFD